MENEQINIPKSKIDEENAIEDILDPQENIQIVESLYGNTTNKNCKPSELSEISKKNTNPTEDKKDTESQINEKEERNEINNRNVDTFKQVDSIFDQDMLDNDSGFPLSNLLESQWNNQEDSHSNHDFNTNGKDLDNNNMSIDSL